ncbi:MAG: hypothetical protein AAF959_27390 [Cyanobacteria bacterium P01_D01_bin.56]
MSVVPGLASERVIKALRLELASSYQDEHSQRVNLNDGEVGIVLEETLGLTEL